MLKVIHLTNFENSGGNKQIIQNLYTYFKTWEGEKIAALFHSDIEWKQMEGFTSGGTYVGPKELFKNVFGQFAKYWKGWAAVPEEFISIDNRIIVLGYDKGKATGNYMKVPLLHIYTLNVGLINHFNNIQTTKL
jgi:ketosteroid isomerase-like protein